MPLLSREAGGSHHLHTNVEVPAATALHARHPGPPHPEDGPRLRALGDAKPLRRPQSGHLDLGTERSLSHAHRNRAVEVAAVAFEIGVLANLENDVKITGRSAKDPPLALAAHAQLHSIL